MKFRIGEKVKFLNETGEGIIRSFRGKNLAMVEIDTGFEIPYVLDQLVKIVGEESIEESEKKGSPAKSGNIRGVKKIILEKEEGERNKGISKKHRRRNEYIVEVDLHIEKLVDNFSLLSNSEIVNIQLDFFLKKLDMAIRNKADKAVFIHGVGSGVLKAEIRKILYSYELEFYDASYAMYGFGATEVIIK